MTTITKEVEFEIDEIETNDICEVLRDRLENSTILYTEEYQEKLKPKISQLIEKLEEIRIWLEYPNARTITNNPTKP